MLYLDNAASTPVRPEVRAAIEPLLRDVYANPSSRHEPGLHARTVLDEARQRVAQVVGVRARDIVFTSGGSESNNLALKGMALARTDRRHLVLSPIEHESVRESARYLERFHGFSVTQLTVDAAGRITADALQEALRQETAVVALGHANNEIGTVQDVAALAPAIAAAGSRLHVDAVQSAGWLSLSSVPADTLAIAGHKLGTPKGIGALVVRGRVPLEPVIHGGGQERGLRSGTENVWGAVALAVALECAQRDQETVHARVGQATAVFIDALLARLPNARLTGDATHRLPGIASFTFAGVNGEAVLIELERLGVLASSGSACAVGKTEASHVLTACGITEELAHTALRFSFGHDALSTEHAAALAQLVSTAVTQVSAP